jgi:hypothetical protein
MNIDHSQSSTDRIRQGETGHGLRYMLGIGTGLAVLALGVMMMLAM